MWVSSAIISAVDKLVEVGYVPHSVTRYWNTRRTRDQPCVFAGWYWVNGTDEAGPFKSRSSAYRDAYFVKVLGVAPPSVPKEIPAKPNTRTRAKVRAPRPGAAA